MTENEIGYLVYEWEQLGYNFIPIKYNPAKDYTKYINYFSNPAENAKLRAMLIDKKKKESTKS